MATGDVGVQLSSDRPNLRAGRTIELVFVKPGGHANMENLTLDQAYRLSRQLQAFLAALAREAAHNYPHQLP